MDIEWINLGCNRLDLLLNNSEKTHELQAGYKTFCKGYEDRKDMTVIISLLAISC